MPVPPVLRGPLAGLAEHAGGWPLVRVTDRLHPARKELPRLSGNRAAFWQAAWRHLVFGVVLGELERRLNPVPPGEEPLYEASFSPNGHGSLEQTAVAG
jgi:hypothetical protein